MTTPGAIRSAVRALLDAQIPARLEAAFVYGSVAAGTAQRSSDLDSFVLLRAELPPAEHQALRRAFVLLQQQLGYRPDETYPVELFTVQECAEALREPLLLRALHTAGSADRLDAGILEADCLEVARALLGLRLPVVDSPVLNSLTTQADQLLREAAGRHGIEPSVLARRLGVRWPGQSRSGVSMPSSDSPRVSTREVR